MFGWGLSCVVLQKRYDAQEGLVGGAGGSSFGAVVLVIYGQRWGRGKAVLGGRGDRDGLPGRLVFGKVGGWCSGRVRSRVPSFSFAPGVTH